MSTQKVRQHDMRNYFTVLMMKPNNSSQRELYSGLVQLAGDIAQIYDRIYSIEQDADKQNQKILSILNQLKENNQKKHGQ